MNDETNRKKAPLPLVVQLGFAGSRRLIDAKEHPGVDVERFEAQIETWLVGRLRQLREDLGLEERHFFCGISSLAIGGDTVFCRACGAGSIFVRIFLAQTRDEFINAVGSGGPDFPTPAQKDEALRLLGSAHVIQERLASDSAERGERFKDVNREIIRVSDVLMCLVRSGSQGEPGGTRDVIDRAVQRGKPVLVIEVDAVDGQPIFSEQWRLPSDDGRTPATPAAVFQLPREPRTLMSVRLSDAGRMDTSLSERYATEIKNVSSDLAKRMRARFRRMIMWIIGAHITATILAAIALAFAKFHLQLIPVLLGLELVMLAIGLGVHQLLHWERTSHVWAEARLLAEMTRSVLAVGTLHVYQEYLFSLPFPEAMRPLLRTINVLALQSTRQDREPWEQKKARYMEKRFGKPKFNQIVFYDDRACKAEKILRWAHIGFVLFWVTALISTAMKIALHTYLREHVAQEELLIGIMGTLAIVMPVLAAAALTMAASLDLEAQEHTYRDMLEFLKKQEKALNTATSERDYAQLVMETESHLLGETVTWFSRRSFRGAA